MRSESRVLACLAALQFASGAAAGNGVLEINQTCAVNTGCFSGDAAGFPVTIDGTAGHSYRLTGDLDLSGEATNVTAVDLLARHITLDLGGFEIAGPSTCTGTGSTLSCTGGGGAGVGLQATASGAIVRNGTVRNMGGNGVGGVANFVRIDAITALHNGADGISGQWDSIVLNSHSRENQDDGFDFDRGTVINNCTAAGNGSDGFEGDGEGVVVTNTTSTGNGGAGYNLQPESKIRGRVSRGNTLEDSCGGGICSERRRYYATQTSHTGANALTACATGFHMASLIEILDGSNLTYDPVLGVKRLDSGEGPPGFSFSWIRTGRDASGDATAGWGNCNAWSSNSSGDFGTLVFLSVNWAAPPESRTPWSATTDQCSKSWGVWCVEDE